MSTNELNDNRLIISWLNEQNGISNRTIEKLLEYFQTPQNIWNNLKDERNNITYLKKEIVDSLLKSKIDFKERINEKLNRENVSLITLLDNEYPQKLKNIINPPYILYCKGNIERLNDLSIAVVGSRKATDYGKWCVEKFSKELSSLGVTIISGLAYGIDSIAHKTALKNNGKTVGVIGCGINIIYPAKNKGLYDQMIDSGNLVISEYPFDAEPIAANFPNRNRIISGLSKGVLVIEAQDKSGTLITANHAAEQGKDVFAVPGNINSIFSIGTNKLIKDGAKIVTCIDDITEEIPELKDKIYKKRNINYKNLNRTEADIIKMLMEGEKSYIDFETLDHSISDIICNLSLLEIKGYITQTSTNKFMLAN